MICEVGLCFLLTLIFSYNFIKMKKIKSLTSCDLGFDQESIKKYFEDRYQMTFSYDKYFEYLHNTEIISLDQQQIDEIF